ncbi:MAG: glycine cleavage T C-terminal barrel domain-containing protein [Chloroflexota bacterium]
MCTGASIGIAQGAGAGKYLAQWMVHGASEINMIGVDPRRFGPYADAAYTDAKTHEAYWNMYDLWLPGLERPAGRKARTTPLYDKLEAKGCVHTEAFGWERPKWFSLDGREEEAGFRRNNTFEVVAEECRAVRERVGILDLSSFSKYEVKGPDAEAFLNRLCANRVSKRQGGMVLSHALTDKGRIQNEFTITRLADDHFYLLSGATSETRDLDILTEGKLDSEDVAITNITDDYGVLVLSGPRSRDLLSKLTDTDLSNETFRWLTGKEIEVAGITLRALRVSYVGELGWELHARMEDLVAVYDAVWEAGEEFGIADFGVYAVNSMRIEKGYRGWGADITNEITPVEADLGRFVKMDKEDFVGKDALVNYKGDEIGIEIIYVEVDVDDADVAGGEPLMDGDKVIGVTTSGGYGHTVQKSLAFAYVEPGYTNPGDTFDIEILGRRCQAIVLDGPVYDPANERMRV